MLKYRSFCLLSLIFFFSAIVSRAKNQSSQKEIRHIKNQNEAYIRYPDGVGQWLELFLDDDYLAATREGIDIVSATAQKLVDKPALKQDQPWELNPPGYTNVIYDEEEMTYKMWYHCLTEFHPYEPAGGVPGQELSMCYAVSDDGITWKKPMLNTVYYKGQRTNIVMSGVTGMKAGAYYVLKDYSEPDPGKRYKVLFNYWDFQGRGLGIGTSPDGIHWRAHPHTVIQGGFDTHNIAFWDALHGCWVAYTRRWQFGRRQISRATSPDLYHWSNDTVLVSLDGSDDNLYTTACFRLREARNVYIMITGVFDSEKNTVTPNLAVSRDGIAWNRFRKPFILPGKEGTWDSGGGYPLAAEVPYGDSLLFYYIGKSEAHGNHHNDGIGISAIKYGRFVGLKAGESGGTVTTHTLRLTHQGGRLPERGILSVNADASEGSIRFEILDENGTPIPDFSRDKSIALTDDNLRHYVRWKSQRTLYPVIGKPVKLRFHMKNATLYGFKVLRHDPELIENQ